MAKTVPVYGVKNPATCVPMSDYVSEGKLLVVVRSDPGVTSVTVSINSQIYTGVTGAPGANQFQLTGYGDPTAIVWTGVLSLTGLTAKTIYPWTVTQGANSDSGGLRTLPASGDTSFQVPAGTCDNNTNHGNATGQNSSNVPGYHQHIRAQAQNVYTPGMVTVDDVFYIDGTMIVDDNSSYTAPGQSGFSTVTNPVDTPTLNKYLIAWMASLGMLGPDSWTASDLVSPTANANLLRVLWAREEDRAWCRKNLSQWAQAGDHAYTDDIGWDFEPATSTAYTHGRSAWNAFYGKIKPRLDEVTTKRDSTADHWAFSIAGVLTVACADFITNAARTWGSLTRPNSVGPDPVASVNLTQFTALMGNNQIDDLKESINKLNSKLCVLALPNSIRYLVTRTAWVDTTKGKPFTDLVTEFNTGAQHPMYEHCIAEFRRLFTQKGIAHPLTALMDSPSFRRKGWVVHGDYHRPFVGVYKHESYNDGTNDHASELSVMVNLATLGASSIFQGVEVGPGHAVSEMADISVLYNSFMNPGNSGLFGLMQTWNGEHMNLRLGDRNDAALWEGQVYPNGYYGPFGPDSVAVAGKMVIDDG